MYNVEVNVSPIVRRVLVEVQAGGIKGDKGDQGERGYNGLSAYEVALAEGFSGTEEEWLESLVGPGDKNFVHSQNTPLASWSVTHNLDKYPSVTVVDSANSIVEGTVNYVDMNTVILEFNGAFTGKAYFN